MATNRHLARAPGGRTRGVRARAESGGRRAGDCASRCSPSWLLLVRPFLRRDLAREPFPVQFRRRLELLGPTYIKLGQILSLREDLLPRPITDELKNLLDRLPVVPFERFASWWSAISAGPSRSCS